MASRIPNCLIVLFLMITVFGCSTAPSHFYALEAAAVPDSSAAPISGAILVGPVSIPAAVDRPQIVVQTATNQVDVHEFDRWVAPLDGSIAQAVAGNLVKLLGTPKVAVAPLANFKPSYVVTIEVQRFESVPQQSATIEAIWTVRKTVGGWTRVGRTVARESVATDGIDALVAAHSRAIAKLSSDIAAAIRAHAAMAHNESSHGRAVRQRDAAPAGNKQWLSPAQTTQRVAHTDR